ncbi:MAG TPA: transcription termination factor Rho [Clostridia bacterium]|nr:transcription termination factor Rho [Clostridia bacterium]
MAQPDFRGKTKKDLSAIAHISGLLTPGDTSRMTKQQLLDFLISMEEELGSDPTATVSPVKEEEKLLEPVSQGDGEETSAKQPAKKKSALISKQVNVAGDEEADTPEAKPVKTKQRATGTRKTRPVNSGEESENNWGSKKTMQTAVDAKDAVVKPGADPALDVDESVSDQRGGKPQDIVTGVLEVMSEGYGFLRIENYIQDSQDIYVPPQYVRRFNLRTGDHVTGPVRQQRDNDRYRALFYIREVNGESPEKMIRRPHFDRLTPIYPTQRYTLETDREELSTRVIDLICPIGKGQRGMIVSPPKAGKTMLLQKIAKAITTNNPEVKLIVLLIDERPEEVTDMQRSIEGEVVYSTFDKTPENHVRITELVLERAMRLVELGHDVIILLDSITRMGRAYNLTINPTGRTLSGGLDPGALYGPKRFFGAARNIEHGGSLTIIATALVETGSRMDEVIFEEFKGTGNMEVILDRKLADKRIFPAIDITRSGTRREELLLSERELDAIWILRKTFSQLETSAVTETVLNLLMKTRDNDQFISSINVSMTDKSLFDAMRGGMPKRNGGR